MILDGKKVAKSVFSRVKRNVAALKTQYSLQPGLAVILIGNDPASQVYVNMKEKRSRKYGLLSRKYELPEDTAQETVITLIEQLNADPSIHGILVQSPPPSHIDERRIIDAILPAKDVDCFHPVNVGKMLIGDEDCLLPCTPAGVIEILKYYDIETSGKHAVVVGRSNIVGKPMAVLLSRKGEGGNCTVTICHSRTVDIGQYTRQADILVAAIGKPHFITREMVKEGAVVIDVGINRIDDEDEPNGYRLVGDVDFDAVAPLCSAITPVPGGVGPMTIAMLLENTVKACCFQNGIALESLTS
ncbi:MAG: bifunctional methylenetetrahydrofolate dehydrogenase/methenyltetrahydrofolate cyclohydrolase FolD [Lentisphaerae bacterium]|nr:MAG: bifunctional methylenetetrahydrofolate dehydrogenase/methenyltetrahydrofolate cyclohydrolase FolD [Lentisphaerota bacterium]